MAVGSRDVMPPEVLCRFGLLVDPRFWGTDECARVCADMATSEGGPATLLEANGRSTIDPDVRRTRLVSVSAGSRDLIQASFGALRPRLECHFGLALHAWQPPQCLVYSAGGHYVPHADSATGPRVGTVLQARKISVILFLNDHAEAAGPDVYGGGALTFWGLFGDSRLNGHGLPVSGHAGLLIAFPSHLTHEVETVTHGVRYTVVGWFV